VGAINISDKEYAIGRGLCSITGGRISIPFLWYAMSILNKEFDANSTGSTFESINTEDVGNAKIMVPSAIEQTRIADYLDQKCAEIDAIIAAKEKTNELLKERRQSIIYEAVTKGLDPTVPMKDSGIEWIGEIPESWDTCKLKYAVESRTKKTVDKSAGVAYIGLEHVKSDFGVLVDEYEHIWDFEGDTIDFKAGDVLFGKLRPYLAKAWAASFNGKCSSEFWVMTPVKLTSKFLLYTVLSNHFIANIDHSTFGVKMPRAEWEYAGNQLICCPSIAEQENITEYLDLKCSEIDSLILENAKSIEMLKEYRQSVIYEAVTGKVEV
jgi:restriction endonuclease S subunit